MRHWTIDETLSPEKVQGALEKARTIYDLQRLGFGVGPAPGGPFTAVPYSDVRATQHEGARSVCWLCHFID